VKKTEQERFAQSVLIFPNIKKIHFRGRSFLSLHDSKDNCSLQFQGLLMYISFERGLDLLEKYDLPNAFESKLVPNSVVYQFAESDPLTPRFINSSIPWFPIFSKCAIRVVSPTTISVQTFFYFPNPVQSMIVI
jgi:hypothetical protein